MEVIEKSYTKNRKNIPTVIALGYFDGIHLGHQKLIKTAIKIAQNMNIKSAVYTFNTHPLSVLSPEKAPKLLFPNNKKIEIIQSLGIDYLVFSDFTRDIMTKTPDKFVKEILVDQFNMKHVVVGFNYKFGYKGIGTPELLKTLGKKHGFAVTVIEPVKEQGTIVSSTNIRKLIANGDMQTTKDYLGHFYSISGKVIRGKGLGKTISIPTANITIDHNLAIPKSGVYKTSVKYNNKKYSAVTNIGYNPTFINHPYSIETHIINLSHDIYDQEIEISFIKRIRSEKKFNSLDELVSQVKKDIAFAEK